jgi:hypothetical protein
VRKNGVAEHRKWQGCQHRRLHRGDDFAGLSANHRKAKNAVVTPTDENLHEALCFVRRGGSPRGAHRQPRDARDDTLALSFALAQSDASEWRLREHAVWNQPIPRAALPSGQIVPDDPKIIDGDVRKL